MHFEAYNFSCIYFVRCMGRYSSLEYALFFLGLSICVMDLIIFSLKDRVTGEIGELN